MSRFSGAWTGFKVVTDVADSHETVAAEPVPDPVIPDFAWRGVRGSRRASPASI